MGRAPQTRARHRPRKSSVASPAPPPTAAPPRTGRGQRHLLPRLPDVVRTVAAGVDDPAPLLRPPLLHGEVERLPVPVDHHVDVIVVLRGAAHAEGQTARVGRQVHRPFQAIPADVLAPEAASAERRVGLAEGDHQPREPEDVAVGVKATPVQPARLVVLVVGVVVAPLCVKELVAGPQHRRAIGEEEQAEEVLRLSLPQRHHLGRSPLVVAPSRSSSSGCRRSRRGCRGRWPGCASRCRRPGPRA